MAKTPKTPNHKTWTYAVKGKTADERELRLAVTPDLDNPGILVITVIDTTRKDLH